jgi:ActR/RegA family two-component response regulator
VQSPSETARRPEYHRRTLQRILAKRAALNPVGDPAELF